MLFSMHMFLASRGKVIPMTVRVEKIVLETDNPKIIQERINAVVGDRKVLGFGAYISNPIYEPVGINLYKRKRLIELFVFLEEVGSDG